MKRKLILFLLCLVTAISCLTFAACDLFDDGNKDNAQNNSAHTHSVKYYEQKDSSCKEEGYAAHWRCETCGEYFSDENGTNKISYDSIKIEKKPHTEVVDKAVEKTCTKDGKTEGKHCSVCGKVTVAQTTIPAGHTEVIDKAVEKTCTTDGKTEGKHCSVCGKVTVAQTTIPAGHTEVIDKAVEKTCTTDGKTEGRHCSECGKVTVAQTTIPAGHTEVVDPAVPNTCTTDGKTEGRHCSECGKVIVAQTTILAAHTEAVDPAVEATCTAEGKTEGSHCSVCNEVLVAQKTVNKLPHTEAVDPAVAATCEQGGKTEGKHCSVCNEVLVARTATPALGHSFGTDKVCSACGAKKASEGLEYKLTSYHWDEFTGDGYEVIGIGTCTDSDIVIPETYNNLPVKSISREAFNNCNIIKNVTFPDSLMYIQDAAFDSSSLETVHIGKGMASSTYFFRASKLQSITVDSENQYMTAVDGVLYSKDLKAIYCHPASHKDASFAIPSTVKDICLGAFEYNDKLETVTMPATVEYIGIRAFRGCTLLTDFTFSTSLKTIDSGAFEDCINLTEANLPEGLEWLGFGAFRGCENITAISLPDSLVYISSQVFIGTGYYNDLDNWELDESYTQTDKNKYGILYIGKFLIEVRSGGNGRQYEIKDGTKSIAAEAIVNTDFVYSDNLTEENLNGFHIAIIVPDSVTLIPFYMFWGYGRGGIFAFTTSGSKWYGYYSNGIGDYEFDSVEMQNAIIENSVSSMVDNHFGDWGYIKKQN